MAYNSTITFGALTLPIESLVPRKVSGTIKQVINKGVNLMRAPGLNQQDWEITIVGIFHDSNKDTDRTTLEGYDDAVARTLTDGLHDGDYYILDLTFDDNRERNTTFHRFTMRLIQNQ